MGKKLKAAVIFIILLLADQLTKLWAVKVLKPIGSIPVIRNVLEIYYVENRITGILPIGFNTFTAHRKYSCYPECT